MRACFLFSSHGIFHFHSASTTPLAIYSKKSHIDTHSTPIFKNFSEKNHKKVHRSTSMHLFHSTSITPVAIYSKNAHIDTHSTLIRHPFSKTLVRKTTKKCIEARRCIYFTPRQLLPLRFTPKIRTLTLIRHPFSKTLVRKITKKNIETRWHVIGNV